jgi:hypothetical protein
MNKFIRNSLSSIILLVLSACNLFSPPSAAVFENSVLRLTVQTQGNVTTFSKAGDAITYQYVITNTGTTRLAGPVVVTDNPRQAVCPGLNTVGNGDNFLDQNETITCAASYAVTPADETAGVLINVARATAGGVTSNQSGLTLTKGAPQPSSTLKLAKTASSQTYGAADQTITYTYVITNTAPTALGQAQFTISDNKFGAPFNCGPANTTLASNQSVTCSMDYKTTPGDMGQPNITNSATATGAGQTSAPVTFTVTNLVAPATQTPQTPATATPSNNPAPGTTILHRVEVGEWLMQIARCYGASLNDVIAANPQIKDPDFIQPYPIMQEVTVPRVGSVGRIYGRPCITFHNVQSGDTWESLALKYNARLDVLQRANPGGLVVGKPARIPLNSAGAGGVIVTPLPGVTPGVTAPAPMRITFDPGATTASRIGIINPNERIQYLVAANVGQMMTINLTAPPNELTLGVIGPTSLALKSPDSLYTWSATVTNAGDHTINLASIAGNSSKSYTLQVSLTNPVLPTATATQTSTTPVVP